MFDIRRLEPGEANNVALRAAAQLRSDASKNRLVNAETSLEQLRDALASGASSTWIALDDGRIVGHLYGALLESPTHGRGVWVGPDGVSFDTTEVLDALYAAAAQQWIDEGAREHFVWVLDDPASTSEWFNLGFAPLHARGVKVLDPGSRELPPGYTIRLGTLDDLELALQLDDELDAFQREGPSFSLAHPTLAQRDDWLETLGDPESRHYIVEHQHDVAAHCVTFPLPALRGAFERTIHLSAVLVREGHRGRGVAKAMIDFALCDAQSQGFRYGETSWRVSNRTADKFWRDYGFETTYVRFHRTIGEF
ncbi:MAG: GNAT family N-acetyltransferase [Acidimicrobiales bacterium]